MYNIHITSSHTILTELGKTCVGVLTGTLVALLVYSVYDDIGAPLIAHLATTDSPEVAVEVPPAFAEIGMHARRILEHP